MPLNKIFLILPGHMFPSEKIVKIYIQNAILRSPESVHI